LGALNYSDNSAVIELMDKPPTSIFDLLDESTSLGSGTDE
jgi:myosin heavy subunit